MDILVIVEQREGKLNRVSWETLTGAAPGSGGQDFLQAEPQVSGELLFHDERRRGNGCRADQVGASIAESGGPPTRCSFDEIFAAARGVFT